MAKNTIIDGIAASEHLDSSGESLSIDGMDISSLGGPDSILNWEHGAKEKPSQVVGKVTFAKKIRKKEDAKTRREKYFWNKSKKPFVYIKAELFDGLGHSGAQDVSAMLKYKNKDKGEDSRLVVGFSIEGGKMDKKGMSVTKSIARDVAITVKPCNKMCDAEILENTKDDKDFLYKNQSFDCEILVKGETYVNLNADKYRNKILEDIKKGETGTIVNGKALNPGTNQKEDKKRANDAKKKQTKIPHKSINKVGWKTKNNMRKALIAGVMSGAPSGLTGMAALATEDLLGSKKKKKDVIKKNQPTMSLQGLGIENNPNMQVKSVDPTKSFKTNAGREVSSRELEGMKLANKIRQGAKAATGVEDLKQLPKDNQEYISDMSDAYSETVGESTDGGQEVFGINVSAPEVKLNESMTFDPDPSKTNLETRNTMKETKGRGNFPSTKHHEGLHHTFSQLAENYSPDHSKNLISYIMDNYFSSENIKSVSNFISSDERNYDPKSPHYKEEHLSHILDLLTNEGNRNDHEKGVQSGARDIDYKQLKSGWQDAVRFTKQLTPEGLNEINSDYSKPKKRKEVQVQRVAPGVSGLKE